MWVLTCFNSKSLDEMLSDQNLFFFNGKDTPVLDFVQTYVPLFHGVIYCCLSPGEIHSRVPKE